MPSTRERRTMGRRPMYSRNTGRGEPPNGAFVNWCPSFSTSPKRRRILPRDEAVAPRVAIDGPQRLDQTRVEPVIDLRQVRKEQAQHSVSDQ